ncbi:IclR family transcriptional regulator [Gemmatimonas sp.]|uniref:IclR family transcriptional regulator n=1 Tax=Gemmatimonas sp. TaxID=1962908 RepID=UPI003569DB89
MSIQRSTPGSNSVLDGPPLSEAVRGPASTRAIDSETEPCDAETADNCRDAVLTRAFRIIDAFNPGEHSLSLTELAKRAGLPKSTAHRLISQLEEWGVLERRGARIRLGLQLFEWGSAVPRQSILKERGNTYAESLSRATRTVVQIGIVDAGEVLYISKVGASFESRIPTSVGSRMPAHCTGLGKAVLAFSCPDVVEQAVERGLAPRTRHSIVSKRVLADELAAVRERGAAIDREEAVLGITCVAAPVLGSDGFAIGAVSAGCASLQFNPGFLLPLVRQVSQQISDELRGRV